MVIRIKTMVIRTKTMVIRNVTTIVSRHLGAGLGATLGGGKSAGNHGCKYLIISSGC
jgi:hypothetical protein